MKISIKRLFSLIGISLLGIVFFFETQLLLINSNLVLIFQIISILCLIFGVTTKGALHFSKSVPAFLSLWTILLLFFLYGLLHSENLVVFRLIISIMVCYLVSSQTFWIKYFKKILMIGGGISIFFTLLFWIIPDLYNLVVDFYGYFPPGTGQIKYGYRAGITANYSQNGIFIAVFIMIIFCLIISENNTKYNKFKNKIRFILLVISVLAFLLNGKRGTLIWCALAVVFTWFVSSEKKSKFLVRITVLGCFMLIALELALTYIPALSFVAERFSKLGTDGSATDRLTMWALAFANFLRSPIFGIGFLNYREQYSSNLASLFIRDFSDISSYRRLDAHNVYIQVLCEQGIVGAFIYITALVLLMKKTIAVLKFFSKKDVELKSAAMISLCLQIFYILYSLSGNCLYDMTFYLYMFAMAIVCSLDYRMKKEKAFLE